MILMIFALWLILNGRITTEIVLLGLLLTGALSWFCYRVLDYSLKQGIRLIKKLPIFLRYFYVLMVEIIKANFRMMAIVLNRNRPVSQTMVYFDVDLHTDWGKTLLANSITLTPGTITVSVDENRFTVHCMSREMISGIHYSQFMQLIQRLEA